MVFIILFTLETAYVVWSISYYYIEEGKIYECYYDICGEYPEAEYSDNVCSCYGYDNLGQLMVVKSKYMR